MTFPTAAVLVFAWFLLTPAIRLVLWLFARRMSWLSRLFIAHVGALLIAIAASAIALDGAELGGMALLFAIFQTAGFLIDFFRPQSPPGV
ncbi:MAG: hypothetical protein ACWA6X_02575 [Bauldia sp.]